MQGAPTGARGRTWRSWALWAMAPTATSSGSGAAPNQTRLAEVFQDRVKIQVRLCVSALFTNGEGLLDAIVSR